MSKVKDEEILKIAERIEQLPDTAKTVVMVTANALLAYDTANRKDEVSA